MAPKIRGPGLRKTRELALLNVQKFELWQSSDYRWRQLFEAADVMSEGATREEPEGETYYGSTSILLPFRSRGGAVPDERASELTRLIRRDPHARLRAVRVACLEAQVRCNAPIGRVRAELFVRDDPRGIRVDVEVEARVFRDMLSKSSPRKAQPSAPKRSSRAS